MKKAILPLLLLLPLLPWLTGGKAYCQWVTAYYAGWNRWNNVPVSETDIDYSTATHWVAFTHDPGTWSGKGSGWDDARLSDFAQRAHAAGRLAILGTGGWGADYTPAVTNISSSIASLMQIIRRNNLDGVDIDWEPVPKAQYSNFGRFVKQLKDALRAYKSNAVLTAACFSKDQAVIDNQKYFDQINLMNYDKSGGWNKVSWHNSAIYAPLSNTGNYGWLGSVEEDVNAYVAGGVPASKIGIGSSIYAYIWTGVSAPLQTGFGNPIANTAGTRYYAIMRDYYLKGVPIKWDATAQAAYFSDAAKFVSVDMETTMYVKADYIRKKGLGGIIIYEVGVANVPEFLPPDRFMKVVKAAFLGGPAVRPLPYIPPAPPPQRRTYVVWDNSQSGEWYNTSWAVTGPVPDPTNNANLVLQVQYGAWGGMRFLHGKGWGTEEPVASDTLVFDIYPLSGAFTATIEIEGGGSQQLQAPANKWTRMQVACPKATFSWFHVMNNTASTCTVLFDNIVLKGGKK